MVHPHMRGENMDCWCCRHTLHGTPPHAWGEFRSLKNPKTITRYTPTCVGRIDTLKLMYIDAVVHPHMRGENNIMIKYIRIHPGTPPHAWGEFFNIF